ncbi:MAG: DUF6666 family protein [Planctomycetia bacterium]
MSGSNDTKLSTLVVPLIAVALLAQIIAPRHAAAQPATDAQLEGATSPSNWKWKPHRHASAAPSSQDTSSAEPSRQESAAPTRDTLVTASNPAPATVGLPDRVPGVVASSKPRAPETAPYAPMRGSIADGMRQMFTPSRTDVRSETVRASEPSFAERMMRSPQGQTGRPIMARETGYGMTDSGAAPRLGGGLAPRYSPAAASSRPRGDRIAMNNVDGLPSVMTRAPQAAAIDESPAPSRLPADSLPAPAGPRRSATEGLPAPSAEVIDPPLIIETNPMDMGFDAGPDMAASGGPGEGLWMGQYPAELHVESFYDDPYACDEEGSVLPLHCCDGRICRWMRQFGKPYYGWKWYRDFTASAGVTAFQNESNFGLLGNYGTNEYLNWAMPFWNAFGVGWQVGARGVQTNFNRTTMNGPDGPFRTNARDQVFVTTGFFTRAFEGRGLQGGAVYDYLNDSYFDNVNVSQLRAELGYVWGYHEIGFWGAFHLGQQAALFSPITNTVGQASTEDLYTGYYRLHFGDANEWRIWGGSTAYQSGIVGSSLRAPMSKSLALEGTFTYLIPGRSEVYQLSPGTSITSSPSAWNVSLNIVYYPARRARRSLASPYRPLFDVADNGSMIRTLGR